MNVLTKRYLIIPAALLAALMPALTSHARPVVPVHKPAPQDRLKFDTRKFMPESDVRYGQKGYALTVIRGTKIDRFNVQLLGVLKKVNNGKDLILFRATSGPSVTRQAMIVAGMSGSPVYVGGRMVGAIAYGLPFSREPMGMITPIKDMLDSWDPDLPAHPGLTPATEGKALQPAMGITIDSTALAPMTGGTVEGANLPRGPMTFEPMMTPIAVSGMSPQGIAKLAADLAQYRLMPVAGGGASGPQNLTTSQMQKAAAGLTPGAAVGVSLAQGDIDLTAIGTLTYRDGNKIVAFGHPFTGIGPIDAALTTASITDIFPSYQESTKVGMPISTVGRIFQDRPFSVGGAIGPRPQMIPVHVAIDDQSDQRQTKFNARIINHPLLTGILTVSVVNEAILEAHGTPGDAVAYVTTDVDADQVGHIVRRNVFFDPLSINSSAVGDLSNIVSLLSANPFYQLGVRSVNVSVRIQDLHATAQIDHIVVPRATYQPGDTVNVGVVLRPYKKEPVVKTVALTIPANTPDGNVVLSVRGGAVSSGPSLALDSSGGITIRTGSGSDAGQPPPATVQQLVKQFLQRPKNNDMVASLSLPSTAPEIGGEKLSLLPPTMAQVMRSAHASALRLARDDVKSTTQMPWVVTGEQTLTLTVHAKNNYDLSTTPDSASAATTTTTPASSTTTSSVTTVISSLDDGSDGSQVDSSPVTLSDVPGSDYKTVDEATHPARGQIAHPATGARTPMPPSPILTGAADPDPTVTALLDTPSTQTIASAPVARVASIWRENTESAFDNGSLDGVTVTSAPDIRVAPAITQIASTSASYVWSQAYDPQGNLYIGTGDDGLIYKIAAGASKPVLFARTSQLEVTGLAFNAATGDLYAATAPHGIVFRIDSAGKAARLAQVTDPYIPAILLDKNQKTLYLATGGGTGRVYALDITSAAGAPARAIFTSPDVHLLCLAQGPDGLLYTGGNPNGVVYRIDPAAATNKGQVVYDSPGPTVSAIAVDSGNRLYIGTAPAGGVYRVDLKNVGPYSAPQIAKPVVAKTSDFVTGLAVQPDDSVWASAGDTLYRITPSSNQYGQDVIATFPSDPTVAYTTIAASPGGHGVTAGTASVGAVYGFRSASGDTISGTYVSAIHDAQLKSRWGAIAWRANVPQGAALQLQTRTGDVPKPDGTWSGWTAAYTDPNGSHVGSPPARFIQYRALLEQPQAGKAVDTSPRLSSVSIYYLPENRPPTARILAPLGSDAVSGTITLRWTGTDPDRDTLEYKLYTSRDDGQTWSQLDTGALRQRSAPSGASASVTTGTTPNSASAAAATRAMAGDLANHPEIPAAVRQRILQESTNSAMSSTAVGSGTTSTSATLASAATPNSLLRAQTFQWNTKLTQDGSYRIKVVADDSPSNAEGALSAEAVSEPFTVVNTPPVIAVYPASVAVDGSITVHGSVRSTLVFVKAVQYKVDDGGWMAAEPVSGLFDSTSEQFRFTAIPTTPGPHHMTIEAFDRAGNTATQSVDTK